MITNPIDRSFPVAGDAWFINELFLMACELTEVERVERTSENGLRIWPAPGHSMETVAAIVQKEMDRRYGQTEQS